MKPKMTEASPGQKLSQEQVQGEQTSEVNCSFQYLKTQTSDSFPSYGFFLLRQVSLVKNTLRGQLVPA